MVLAQKRQEWPQATLLKDVISENRAVSSNVPQRPDSLFTNIENGGGEQLDELLDGAGIDDHLGVVSGSRGDVC